jgi:spore germination protein GerM
MGRISSRSIGMLLLGCALIVAAGTGWFLAKRSLQSPPVVPVNGAEQQRDYVKEVVHLYFGDQQGHYLRAEQRVLDLPEDVLGRGRLLMDTLLAGPVAEGTRTLPEGSRLRSFFITADGTAYVDLEKAPLDRHPGGVETELLSIYSIVNTLVLNVDSIRAVKFLIGGQEDATLAGHVGLRHAFEANMLWIR